MKNAVIANCYCAASRFPIPDSRFPIPYSTLLGLVNTNTPKVPPTIG
ncbi:hypothetical protein [Moorena sp. SIO3I6]|nr:hypothetical protein [Moorena sp. SIO3I6]NEP24594.1 hypothetical protein [Moorena sp. SIO3I6]